MKKEENMFKCDHKVLHLSFNDFHDVKAGDMPEYDEFCLLRLKDGRYTAGKWYPSDYRDKNCISGEFGRGGFDTIDASEVSKWHSFDRYNLSSCLKEGSTKGINIGEWIEDSDKKAEFGGFCSTDDGDFPKNEQYCLLILKDGRMAGGRWNLWRGGKGGQFIYASALSSFSMKEVWAWTALSSDRFFEMEEEKEREKKLEEELNRNPSADPEKFKYGTDINVYYRMALKKLRKEFPWAKLAQMRKKTPYVIVPRHGQYIFGQDNGYFGEERMIREWTEGSTADEFIDFLYGYTKNAVRDSNPAEKFRLGMDIEVYLEKAYENVKNNYRWLDKKTAAEYCEFAIKKVHGDWEFVRRFQSDKKFYVCDCSSAERFIEIAEHDYQEAAIRANPVVNEYKVSFGSIEIHGWYLEKYIFYKLRSGDYKVSVQAGDRVTGGGRDFFITPYCFEAESYEEFLDRYLEIVPAGSFGLGKEELLPDEKLKEFLGY
ncbi:MAG: hypothetical protein IKI75_13205 [Lachnospiraceae bacterium]|nr:hypothetical protein [Lachnospiraceae bacterium]